MRSEQRFDERAGGMSSVFPDRQDSVSQLRIFPIKSCQAATLEGSKIDELEIGPIGFQIGGVVDRGWVLAGENDHFVSQRGWNENNARKHRGDRMLASVSVDIRHDHLRLSAPGHGDINVPLHLGQADRIEVGAFSNNLLAAEGEEDAHLFFSELVGRPVRLMKIDLDVPRRLKSEAKRPGAANRTAGADQHPMSLTSQASLDQLHDEVQMPRGTVPIDRFRSNVDIAGDGFGPFAEDRLRQVRVGAMEAHVVKPIVRCVVTNIDQQTGDDTERLAMRILRSRTGWERGLEEKRGGTYFAQTMNHVYPQRVTQPVKVGDPVVAMEVGESNVVLRGTRLANRALQISRGSRDDSGAEIPVGSTGLGDC